MKTLFRSLITALVIIVIVEFFAIGVVAPTLPRVAGLPTVRTTRTLTLPATKEIEVLSKEGWTRVHGNAVSTITVKADIRLYVCPGTKPTEAGLTSATTISSTQRKCSDASGNDCTVVGLELKEMPEGFETSINYDIQVPIGTDVSVKSINGNVLIAPGCGKVIVDGGNTDIDVAGPGEKVTAQSVNGRISVTEVVKDATISTVNGSIYVDASGGAIRASTINGAIVANLQGPQLKSCELVTKNGSITALLQDQCPVAIRAQTERGAIRCNLPEISPLVSSMLQHLVSNVGEGRVPLTLETLNGNIRITRSDR